MLARQTSLPAFAILPALVPAPPLSVQPPRSRWPDVDPLPTEALTPSCALYPAAPWRDSLAVVTGRMARFEAWAFLALATLVLPAAAINQSILWHLLNGGALDRAIRAFLFVGGR